MIRWHAIEAAFPNVDDEDALLKAESDLALRCAMDICRPTNWHGTGASYDLLAAAQDEGLPLAWVPPADIIRQLRSAGSAPSRESALLDGRNRILDACVAAIEQCNAPELAATRKLVINSIAALRDNHNEAGMALAVSVGEGLAYWAVEPRVRVFDSRDEASRWQHKWAKTNKYKRIDLIQVPAREVERKDFIHQVLIAPISHFFTPFVPGDPKPSILSRHVVAHDPTPDHMTPVNALKSVMLVTGILRSQQDWIEETGEAPEVPRRELLPPPSQGATLRRKATSRPMVGSCSWLRLSASWLAGRVHRCFG